MADSNVRSPGYFIARMLTACRHCDRITEVFAFAVPPTHEFMTDDEWNVAGVAAFLFFISWLPDSVLSRLAARKASEGGWLNHCEHCGTPQEDEELHCEPGAFMPTNESEAANIELVYVDEAFEAAAAGYAPDPEFVTWPLISSI
jgi:hypothetical protein